MKNWVESELKIYQLSHPCLDQTAAGGEIKCCRWKWTQVQNGRPGAPKIGLARQDALPATVCAYDMGAACTEGQEAVTKQAQRRWEKD